MQRTIRPREIIRRRNRRLKLVTLAIVLLAAGYTAFWWYQNRYWVTTDDAFVTGHLITVETQTAGTVIDILAENTQRVKRGDVLVRLNGARAKIALERAEAELGEAVRNIVTLIAKVDTLRQRIVAQEAALTRVRHDLRRFIGAARDGAVSDQKVQNAQDRARELEATIRETRAELEGVKAQIQGTTVENHPAVEKAKSEVRRAFLEYHRRNIVAPISGYVAKRRVQVGDQVPPATPLLAIVPLDDLWVDANFLETKIAHIRPGQSAEIRVDAYGDDFVYHGVVEGLNPGTGSIFALLPPENATGNFIHIVERVPVRIALNPEQLREHPLRPGLSTVTRINIAEKGGAPLASTTRADRAAYRTDVYAHELDEADARIEAIVAANRTPKQAAK